MSNVKAQMSNQIQSSNLKLFDYIFNIKTFDIWIWDLGFGIFCYLLSAVFLFL
jgi:hypothetical protein